MERFWSKVDVRGSDECWEWKAARNRHGYGYFRYKSKHAKAHRVSWELTQGEIPDGINVLHRCDNPPCCNPAHLFLGTQAENMSDKVAKGRQQRGEGCRAKPERRARGSRNGRATLNELQVVGMMARHLQGVSVAQVAREFNAPYKTVSSIIRGENWSHIFRPTED